MLKLLKENGVRALLCVAIMILGLVAIGCQTNVGGQTLPSAHYLSNNVQYFPAGPRMKLSQEAAAQTAYNEEMAARQTQEATK